MRINFIAAMIEALEKGRKKQLELMREHNKLIFSQNIILQNIEIQLIKIAGGE